MNSNLELTTTIVIKQFSCKEFFPDKSVEDVRKMFEEDNGDVVKSYINAKEINITTGVREI